MKTYIHIGVDKCGSSSLQRFLSTNGLFLNNQNKYFEYRCFSKKGILSPEKIKLLSSKNKKGYESSMSFIKILDFEETKLNGMIDKNKIQNVDKLDQIFSCEDWYRGLKKEKFISILSKFLVDNNEDKLIFIAFLKSPVLWINSAWWEWGAWQSNKNKYYFEDWLEKMIINVNWYRHFKLFNLLNKNHQLILKPIKKDIIIDFSKILNLKEDLRLIERINTGLPIEILKFYLKYPKLSSILKKTLFKKKNFVGNVPWILSQSNIRTILYNTYESNKKLLNLMEEEDKNFLINDRSWWDIDFYKNKITFDPYLEDFNPDKSLIKSFLEYK